MSTPVSDEALDIIFRQAHTTTAWLPKPVDDHLLHQLYHLFVLGPTSANMCPMRVVFVKSTTAKERLKRSLMEANIVKSMAAPVTAIVAIDSRFYEFLPTLFPVNPGFAQLFGPGKEEFTNTNAFRNATLQGGYLIIAARALGLNCGPMSGFDNAKVDADFFPDGRWKSNFLVNLGYGEPSKHYPRLPRLPFETACKIE